MSSSVIPMLCSPTYYNFRLCVVSHSEDPGGPTVAAASQRIQQRTGQPHIAAVHCQPGGQDPEWCVGVRLLPPAGPRTVQCQWSSPFLLPYLPSPSPRCFTLLPVWFSVFQVESRPKHFQPVSYTTVKVCNALTLLVLALLNNFDGSTEVEFP